IQALTQRTQPDTAPLIQELMVAIICRFSDAITRIALKQRNIQAMRVAVSMLDQFPTAKKILWLDRTRPSNEIELEEFKLKAFEELTEFELKFPDIGRWNAEKRSVFAEKNDAKKWRQRMEELAGSPDAQYAQEASESVVKDLIAALAKARDIQALEVFAR